MATSSSVKVPIFIDTNLETHIAMAVSPEITAGDLKRDFRREHSICFPSLGEIRITGLMVKRKSFFYHLPDSMVIKNVFQGLKGIWFIRMDADLVKKSNYSYLSDGVAEIRGSDVNLSNVTEAQTHENHINDIDKNNMENTSRKMKKKRTMEPEGLMEELLVPDSIGKKKKWTKRRIKEKCNQEVMDEGNNKDMSTSKEDPVISSGKQFCKVDTTKEPNLGKEQISPSTVGISTVSSSEIVAEIRGSDVNLGNVTEAQTLENHINDIDKNNMENTSRKMKKKRKMRLEGLMEELLMPVSIGKKKKRKKRRIKEKCFHQEVVDEGKNKALHTTEEEPVISSRKHFCNVDTTKETNLREEQISPSTVGISSVSSSEIVAEIRGSDVNLSNVTQTHENHINDIDKNITENASRKMKKKRTMRLEGLMEELLVPVSIGKKKNRKKRRIQEKCFNQEIVEEGNNKVLPPTKEDPVISSRKQFCKVDTMKEPNLGEEQISPSTVGISTVSSPEIVSVTGIITRYFSEFDEVKSLDDHPGCDIGDELQSCIASQGHQDKSSKTVKAEHCRQPPEPHTLLSVKTLTRMLSHPLPADPSPETSRKEFGRTEVGKRLLLAANDLKISNSNKKSSTNIFHSRGGMFSPSVVRTLVFEVTDSDG